MSSHDSFTIDIVLRHPSYAAEDIMKALSLASLVPLPKATYFYAQLQKGSSVHQYGRALNDVILFLRKHERFLTAFMKRGGDVELIVNHNVTAESESGDKCFELFLSAEFLRALSDQEIGLRVQGWRTGEALRPD